MDTRSDEKYGTPPHPDCVIWTYKKGDGTEVEIFDDALALATLLMEGCVYINTHWGEKEWPPEAQQTISFNVGCNDIFSWGCADSEKWGMRISALSMNIPSRTGSGEPLSGA